MEVNFTEKYRFRKNAQKLLKNRLNLKLVHNSVFYDSGKLPAWENLVFQLWPKIFPANQIAEEEINVFHFLHGDNHQGKVESEATFSSC